MMAAAQNTAERPAMTTTKPKALPMPPEDQKTPEPTLISERERKWHEKIASFPQAPYIQQGIDQYGPAREAEAKKLAALRGPLQQR
jgi:hypothetical protein